MKRLPGLFLFTALLATSFLSAQNDKIVVGDAYLTPGEIENGASITYLIRFQNLGNDTAHAVVIRDTLDPRLDDDSFEMLFSSHEYELLRDGDGILRWFFNDIKLPNNVSGGSGSIGSVMFTIKPKPFLAPGQVILNSACMKFDNGFEACTNDAPVWIDDDASAGEPQPRKLFDIFPNPNHGSFGINPAENEPKNDQLSWWITDMNGRSIQNGQCTGALGEGCTVSLDESAPGLYFLWVKSARNLQVEQLVVLK